MRHRADRKPKQVKVETPKPVEVKKQPKQKSLRGVQQKLF